MATFQQPGAKERAGDGERPSNAALQTQHNNALISIAYIPCTYGAHSPCTTAKDSCCRAIIVLPSSPCHQHTQATISLIERKNCKTPHQGEGGRGKNATRARKEPRGHLKPVKTESACVPT
ncbi:hypothetical protein MHYP_G00078930 [Metynnis hypsauchen]